MDNRYPDRRYDPQQSHGPTSFTDALRYAREDAPIATIKDPRPPTALESVEKGLAAALESLCQQNSELLQRIEILRERIGTPSGPKSCSEGAKARPTGVAGLVSEIRNELSYYSNLLEELRGIA